jgi:hypothetical protein
MPLTFEHRSQAPSGKLSTVAREKMGIAGVVRFFLFLPTDNQVLMPCVVDETVLFDVVEQPRQHATRQAARCSSTTHGIKLASSQEARPWPDTMNKALIASYRGGEGHVAAYPGM